MIPSTLGPLVTAGAAARTNGAAAISMDRARKPASAQETALGEVFIEFPSGVKRDKRVRV